MSSVHGAERKILIKAVPFGRLDRMLRPQPKTRGSGGQLPPAKNEKFEKLSKNFRKRLQAALEKRGTKNNLRLVFIISFFFVFEFLFMVSSFYGRIPVDCKLARKRRRNGASDCRPGPSGHQ